MCKPNKRYASVLLTALFVLSTLLIVPATYAETANESYPMEVSLQGNDLYIKTPYDDTKSLVQKVEDVTADANRDGNAVVDFDVAWLASKTGDDWADYSVGQALTAETMDGPSPFWINDTYIGANHGDNHASYIISMGHGKTAADIGTKWVDGNGTEWVLFCVRNENRLEFMPASAANRPKYIQPRTDGTLTAADDSGASIAYTASDNRQLFPSIRNHVRKVYAVNGNMKRELSGTQSVGCTALEIHESYTVIDQRSIADEILAQKQNAAFTANPNLADYGTDLMDYEVIYTFTADGTLLTQTNHTIKQTDVTIERYHGVQSNGKKDSFGGGVYRYLPDTKAFTVNGTEYDYSAPACYEGSGAAAFPNYYYPVSACINKTTAGRTVDYLRGSDNTNEAIFSMGYLPAATVQTTEKECYQIWNSKKAYPFFLNGQSYSAGDKIQMAAYRKWSKADSDTTQSVYSVPFNGLIYTYADVFENGKTVTLPENATLVVKSENMTGSDQVFTADLSSEATSSKTHAYVVYTQPNTQESALEDDLAALTEERFSGNQPTDAITSNLDFSAIHPAEGITASFSSSDDSIINASGVVSRPTLTAKTVTVTVTLSRGGESASKDFNYTVLPLKTKVIYSDNFNSGITEGITGNYTDAGWKKKQRDTALTLESSEGALLMNRTAANSGDYGKNWYVIGDAADCTQKAVTVSADFKITAAENDAVFQIYSFGNEKGSAASYTGKTNLPRLDVSKATNGKRSISIGGVTVRSDLTNDSWYTMKLTVDIANGTSTLAVIPKDNAADVKTASAAISGTTAQTYLHALEVDVYRSYTGAIAFDNMVVSTEDLSNIPVNELPEVCASMISLTEGELTESIALPTAASLGFPEGVTLTWQADHEAVLDSTGHVTRPYTISQKAGLTAVVSAEGAQSAEKSFNFIVLPIGKDSIYKDDFESATRVNNRYYESVPGQADNSEGTYFITDIKNDAASTDYQVVIADDPAESGHGKALKLYSTTSKQFVQYTRSANEADNIAVVENDFYFEHDSDESAPRYTVTLKAAASGAGASWGQMNEISFDYVNQRIYVSALHHSDSVTLNYHAKAALPPVGTWFNFKAVSNLQSKTTDFYIDGEKINDTPIPYYWANSVTRAAETYPNMNGVDYRVAVGKGTMYVDNFELSRFNDSDFVAAHAKLSSALSGIRGIVDGMTLANDVTWTSDDSDIHAGVLMLTNKKTRSAQVMVTAQSGNVMLSQNATLVVSPVILQKAKLESDGYIAVEAVTMRTEDVLYVALYDANGRVKAVNRTALADGLQWIRLQDVSVGDTVRLFAWSKAAQPLSISVSAQ